MNDWELDNVEDFLSRHDGKSMKREVKDSVVWMDSRNEVFSIESFYSILRSRHAILSPMAIIWNSWLPSKVCFFSLHGKLVTTKCWPWIIFRKRGWVLANRCVLCKCKEESIDHVLIHCVIVRVLWLLLCSLFEFVWVLSSTVEDILLGRRGSFVVWNHNKVWRTISLCIF